MTYPLTHAHLSAAGVPRDRYYFLEPLNSAMAEFDITTGERPAMFLAQVAHESAGFHYLCEIWGPTTAQAGYEGRADLGNTERGDGMFYRGHGLIQITGRANHRAVADRFGIPFDSIVPWLQRPEGASRSAAWYWAEHGCNELADAYDFVAVTRRINGGLNGLADRTARYTAISAV